MNDKELVEYGLSLGNTLNDKLALGMTRWVIRHGSLGDGHEKITPAQKYFQSIREMYYISINIAEKEAGLLEANADLMDAEESLKGSLKETDRMRAQARLNRAQLRVFSLQIEKRDAMRQLDEFNKIRLELEAEVTAKYPAGIEQAERDNWLAVYKYRKHKGDPMSWNIPLPVVEKAALGLEYGCAQSIAPLAAANPGILDSIPNDDPEKLYKLVIQSAEKQQLEVKQ